MNDPRRDPPLQELRFVRDLEEGLVGAAASRTSRRARSPVAQRRLAVAVVSILTVVVTGTVVWMTAGGPGEVVIEPVAPGEEPIIQDATVEKHPVPGSDACRYDLSLRVLGLSSAHTLEVEVSQEAGGTVLPGPTTTWELDASDDGGTFTAEGIASYGDNDPGFGLRDVVVDISLVPAGSPASEPVARSRATTDNNCRHSPNDP